MRFCYDCEDEPARQRLASTIFFFLLAVNGAAARRLARWPRRSLVGALLGAPGYTLALQLVLLNTFAIGFTFIPFHVLRIEQRARDLQRADARALGARRSSCASSSSSACGLGVMGVVLADVVVTAA